MRLTGLGKLIIVILAVGIVVGAWRMWQSATIAGGSGKTSITKSTPGDSIGDFFSRLLPKKQPISIDPNNGEAQPPTNSAPTGADNEILFVMTPAKKGWVQDQINRFNAKQNGRWKIVTQPYPSREGMHAILHGQIKPVLWSPGSPIWPTRLAEVWKAEYSTDLLDMNDPNANRSFLRSPLVFLTTKQKARFLRPLLGGPTPWVALRDLSTGKKRTPWGRFRWSHADPLTSSSGMMTLGLVLYDYGLRTGQSGNLERLAQSTSFMNFVRQLETSLVYDKAAQAGTTALTKAFLKDTSSYDVITAYEAAALEAASSHPDLAVIYPSPTAVSEHAVTLLNAGWITPTQREGALAFINYLGSPEALREGIKYYFRPAQSGGDFSLNPILSQHSGQGFQQSYSSIELPGYKALNAAAFQWSKKIAGR
jgi:hypothetical protein